MKKEVYDNYGTKILFTSLTAAALYLATGSPSKIQAVCLTGGRSGAFKSTKVRKKAVSISKIKKSGKPMSSEADSENKQSQQPDQVNSDLMTFTAHSVNQKGEHVESNEQLKGKNGDSHPDSEMPGYEIKPRPDSDFSAQLKEVTYVNTDSVSKPKNLASHKSLPRSVIDSKWNGLDVTFDSSTGLLTIPGGTVNNPQPLYNRIPNVDGENGIKKINITGSLKLTGKASYMFAWLKNLEEIEGLRNLDTSEVTDMNAMFFKCIKLNSLDVSKFRTSNVTNMSSMFAFLKSLEEITGLSKLDTSGVKNMSYMFGGSDKLTSLDLSNFETKQVRDMSQMFANCENLTSIEGLSGFVTTQVTNMQFMFFDCSNLSNINVGKFETSQVTNMTCMFSRCSNLNSLDISGFNMSAVENRVNMLNSLPELNTIILGKDNNISGTGLNTPGIWLNVGKGTQDKPEGNKKWTSSQLMANYNGTTDHDTYVRTGFVNVHYRDEANNQLASDEILKGRVGNKYISKSKEIPGYVLKSNPTDASGTFTDDAKEVTYVYAKAAAPSPEQTDQGAAVTVHYQDAKGNMLASDEILTGKVGAGYVSAAKTIAGYVLVTRPRNATGFFSQNPQSVTYIYAPEESENGKQPEQNGSGSGNNGQNQAAHHSNSKGKRPHSIQNNNQMQTGKLGQWHKAAATEKKATKKTESGKLLPQTGSAGRERTLALMLGSLSVISGLIGGWINRNKKRN